MLTLTRVRCSWGMPLSLALLVVLLLQTGHAMAAGQSLDVTYHQIVVWTGLSDQGIHSLVVFNNGFQDEHSRAPNVMVGPYGIDGNDVAVELSPVEGGWHGLIYDINGGYMGTVTVSYAGTGDVRLLVSAGTLRTEREYLDSSADPPACRGGRAERGLC